MTDATRYAMIPVEVRVPADLRHDQAVAGEIALAAQEYANETYGRDYDGSEPEPVTQDPETMPATVHGETVVSAFRHLPLYGLLEDKYTVITRDSSSPPSAPRYSVFRSRFAPALGRWSIDTDYRVDSNLPWNDAASEFADRVTQRVS
jgi:hypothetical protein